MNDIPSASTHSAHHGDEAAVDSSAVLRDDVLIDALAKGVLPMEHADDSVVHTLLSERADIHATPLSADLANLNAADLLDGIAGEASSSDEYVEAPTQLLPPLRQINDIVTPSTAAGRGRGAHPRTSAGVAGGGAPGGGAPGGGTTEGGKGGGSKRRPPQSRPRTRSTASTRAARAAWMRKPLILASIIVAITFGSLVGLAAARTAESDSPLFPLTRVVNSERAESLEARDNALAKLKKAQELVGKNDTTEARQQLEKAIEEAQEVRPQEQGSLQTELKKVEKTIEKVEEANPTPSPTGSPSPSPSESGSPTPSTSESPSPTSTKAQTSSSPTGTSVS